MADTALLVDLGKGIPSDMTFETLNKSRKKAIYYCPITAKDGTVSWARTRPLPADPQSIAMYFAKGFRAKPPGATPKEADVSAIKCPFCDFKPESALALRSHLRVHIDVHDKKEDST